MEIIKKTNVSFAMENATLEKWEELLQMDSYFNEIWNQHNVKRDNVIWDKTNYLSSVSLSYMLDSDFYKALEIVNAKLFNIGLIKSLSLEICNGRRDAQRNLINNYKEKNERRKWNIRRQENWVPQSEDYGIEGGR